MAYTLDTQLGTLLDDPKAKAVIDKYIPGVTTHPMIGMARGFTLNMILATPQAAQFGLTKEKLEPVLAEINKLEA
jgi:hypothetical protein